MADSPDVTLIRKVFQAAAAGDVRVLREVIAPDCAQHIPGNSPIGGETKGRDAVLETLNRRAELTDGTFQAAPELILENGRGLVTAVSRITAKRDRKKLDARSAQVFQIVDGKIEDIRLLSNDLDTVNAFFGGTKVAASKDVATVRKGYAAFGKGDLGTLRKLFAPDVVHRVGGNSTLTGDYEGPDAVLELYGRIAEESHSTFTADLEEVFEDRNGHVLSLHRERAERNGRQHDQRHILLFTFLGGLILSLEECAEDLKAEDAFWA
ncbi:MAG TPA: nuclear transport factor 2 family protein [Mycobacteriales bacterium]|nr:nuclear transport factor 2 family protein [Mycobacteriales bacterium]